MASGTPARDFLLPRLTAIVDDAMAHGFARPVVVTVLIDLMTAPGLDTAVPDPKADSAPHPDYQRLPGAPPSIDGVVVGAPAAIGAQDEADFLLPPRWDR